MQSGEFIAVGFINTLETPECGDAGVIKFSQEGDIFWESNLCFLPEGDLTDPKNKTRNILYDIIELEEGGFIATGASIIDLADSFPQQGWIIRLDAEGEYVNSFEIPIFSETKNFEIFPNPAYEQVTIDLQKDKINKLKIYNSLGNQIYSQSKIEDSKFKVNVSQWNSGVYFILVNDRLSRKLMVIH